MAEETQTSVLDQIQKYQDELKIDIQVDQLTMKDVALQATAVKHKWIGRLMRHKADLHRMDKQRNKALEVICERISQDPTIQLSSAAIRKKAEQHETVVKIDEHIENQKLLVEYLEKVEKIVTSLTWDLKNIVEMVKLETQ